MSADVLLGFGDSWPSGADLAPPDEKNYLTQLAEHFGIDSINFSRGGSSIPHLILQINEFIKTQYCPNNRYHAVFFLTTKERTFVYNNDRIVEFSPGYVNDNNTDNVRVESYYKHIYDDQLGTFNLNITVLALQQICATYGIKDYYTAGWQEIELWPTINRTKFFADGKPITTIFTADNKFRSLKDLIIESNPYVVHPNCPPGHPNQQGHAKIAQALANWIKI